MRQPLSLREWAFGLLGLFVLVPYLLWFLGTLLIGVLLL